jgi:hypothetical protein
MSASLKRTKIYPKSLSGRSARIRSPISPFMELPQELKDMVYHELWKLTPSIHLPQLDLCYECATDSTQVTCLGGSSPIRQ